MAASTVLHLRPERYIKGVPDERGKGLALVIARAKRDDAAFRRAWADLGETCAYVVDPRDVDASVTELLTRYVPTAGPIAEPFEAVLGRLDWVPEEGSRQGAKARRGTPPEIVRLLVAGIETLVPDRGETGPLRVLDPWAGAGEIVAGFGPGFEVHANVADPQDYARAWSLLRSTECPSSPAPSPPEGRGGFLCFAESFRLPDRTPTGTFEFAFDENTERVARQQATGFDVVVADLRRAGKGDARTRRRVRESFGEAAKGKREEGAIRWMADRVGPRGVLAFVCDENWVDEPAFGEMRAGLAQEFGSIFHVALPDGLGLSFLVRGVVGGLIRYARRDDVPEAFETVGWEELLPTERHVWRPEILRAEWPTFLALAGESRAVFGDRYEGIADGHDAVEAASKTARRVLRRPFAPVWRTPDRAARRAPVPPEGPTLIVLSEPYGVFATALPPDRRCGAPRVLAVPGSRVGASAMRRFRTLYGAGVVERDVFDYVLALLHHPRYAERYHEDLRRGGPRVPVVLPEAMEALGELSEAPEVGPGTAFRTGWTSSESFEPGALPDYDDPFASPYARADVEAGFLLFTGLGAALYRAQVHWEAMRPYPLERLDGGGGALRLSRDRTWVAIGWGTTLAGIPEETLDYRIGRRSALEWAIEGMRPHAEALGREAVAARVGKAVAASREVSRLVEIVGAVDLRF